MNRASLEELLRAAAEMVEFERICIIGSASLLVDYPSLGEQGQPLAASLDADFVLLPEDAEKARILLANRLLCAGASLCPEFALRRN